MKSVAKTILYCGCIFCLFLIVDIVIYIVDMVEALKIFSELETAAGDYGVANEVMKELLGTKFQLWFTLFGKIFMLLFSVSCFIMAFNLDDKICRCYERKVDKPNQEPMDVGY